MTPEGLIWLVIALVLVVMDAAICWIEYRRRRQAQWISNQFDRVASDLASCVRIEAVHNAVDAAKGAIYQNIGLLETSTASRFVGFSNGIDEMDARLETLEAKADIPKRRPVFRGPFSRARGMAQAGERAKQEANGA